MNSFSSSDRKGFDIWISNRLDEKYSWEEIENLCSEEEDFKSALDDLIETEMWPEELTHTQWKLYVEYYKKLHPSVVLSQTQKVVGIDNNGLNNTFGIPTGASSTWEQYRKSLSSSMGPASVINIEKSCQWVMNHLKEDTTVYGPVKGLVTGSVQSGKTANMAGLVSMAADCNWNFFIILSGTIDNLRKQTRDRFKKDLKQSEGILWRVLDFTGEDKKFAEDELKLNPLGKKTFANRYVTVCLKNKKRLETLIDWLYDDPKRTQKLRIVVIDDEADQASVNTAEITPDEEQERCAINQLIVNLVNGRKSDGSIPDVAFQAMNYIAYTATPYANVLNERPGESLYPKDFICTLPESTEYFGAKVIFGNDEKNCPGMGIVRTITATEEKTLKNLHKGLQTSIPESMKDSIAWFLCVSAVLRVRPHARKRSISMLLHTTAIQNQHFNVYDAVQLWLKNKDEVLERCERIYESEKGTVTKEELKASNPDYGFMDEVCDDYPEFSFICAEIECMLNDVRNILLDDNKSLQYSNGIHVCVDNCKANKEAEEGTTLRIVYPTDKQITLMEKDPVFLVIGGNTLARGLTIDGLVCSYFSRNSNQADTLMQMARWFGYRKGFELMQRIWMTNSVHRKFEALSKIDMDMKEEIERFMERGISPALFGPRIRNIPEIKSFRITSKKKSQQAEYDDFDFSGDTYETTDFDNGEVLKKNIEVTDAFIAKISQISSREVSKTVKAFVWKNIDYKIINNELISKYIISSNSGLNVNIPIFCRWIEKMNEDGKYSKWNVAVINGDNHEKEWRLDKDTSVGLIERTRKKSKPEWIDIGSLRSGRDALADVDVDFLDDKEQAILAEALKNGKDIIAKRSQIGLDDFPLLLLYRIKKDGGEAKKLREKMDADYDIIGISIIVSGDGIGGNHAKSIRINIPKQSEED